MPLNLKQLNSEELPLLNGETRDSNSPENKSLKEETETAELTKLLVLCHEMYEKHMILDSERLALKSK